MHTGDLTVGRSHWPEFAVKVVSASKMRQLGYEGNVAREVVCLCCMSHPGVARLISHFKYTSGIYMV